jgi:hypothetical protein
MSATEQPVIACVAFVGHSSEPLYLKAFPPSDDDLLKLHLAVFSALDVIDERVPKRKLPAEARGTGGGGGAATTPQGSFLNLLMPVEDFKVFGYVTATSIKIIVIVKDVLLREERVRNLFVLLHGAYADAVASPFAPVGNAPLDAPAFVRAVDDIVATNTTAIRYTGPCPF